MTLVNITYGSANPCCKDNWAGWRNTGAWSHYDNLKRGNAGNRQEAYPSGSKLSYFTHLALLFISLLCSVMKSG